MNIKIYDYLQKRKLKNAITCQDYHKIYYTIINYERIAGMNFITENIKKYSIFKIINNEFVNSKIFDKKSIF